MMYDGIVIGGGPCTYNPEPIADFFDIFYIGEGETRYRELLDLYKACKKEGVKPIIGCEVYVAPRTRFDKEPNIDNHYYHLILLAKNEIGYKNLSNLVSMGFTEGFYYKPRIDYDILEKYHEGLIALSACIAGNINREILNNNIEKAEEIALWHKRVFGEDYYIEIQNNGIKEQVLANQKLVQLARKLDIPLVATNDAHYLKKEDASIHKAFLNSQDGDREVDSFYATTYMMSTEELESFFDEKEMLQAAYQNILYLYHFLQNHLSVR